MNFLEERILKDGKVKPGNVLKVDLFLHHQKDIAFLDEIGWEFKRRIGHKKITKVLTIEASGIAAAAMTGYVMGCPMVFAKKSKSRNISDDVYSVEVASFTHGNVNTVVCSKEYLNKGDRVLIIDDFLANGSALSGLKALVEQAGGTVVGAGILIEKEFQGGGNMLRSQGMRVESLAKIAEMGDDCSIRFC